MRRSAPPPNICARSAIPAWRRGSRRWASMHSSTRASPSMSTWPGSLPAERQIYIDQWSRPGALTAMLNWYRSSQVVVPAVGENAAMPGWVERGVPRLKIPVRVIWGLEDKALLPIQLRGHRRGWRGCGGFSAERRRAFRAVGSAGPGCGGARPLPCGGLSGYRPAHHDSLHLAFRRPACRRAGALPAGNGRHADRAPDP